MQWCFKSLSWSVSLLCQRKDTGACISYQGDERERSALVLVTDFFRPSGNAQLVFLFEAV